MPIIGSRAAWQGQERLSEEARRAVQRAEAAGAAYGLRQATPDVLLLALLTEEEGVPARALLAHDVDPVPIRAALEASLDRGKEPLGGLSLLDAASREAVVLGTNEARRGGFAQVGPGHLLLGALQAREGVGYKLLSRQGADVGRLRSAVTDLEMANDDGDAALFAAAFEGLLARIGGANACPRCQSPVHTSFHHCYNCGVSLD